MQKRLAKNFILNFPNQETFITKNMSKVICRLVLRIREAEISRKFLEARDCVPC